MSTLSNVATRGGEENPPSVRLTPDTIPEAKSSQTGVSLEYAPDPDRQWYVLRATYGRERFAYEYIKNDGTSAYLPQHYVNKIRLGKSKKILQPLIPNLLFVYSTKEKVEEYVKRTPCLSFLRYYYDKLQITEAGINPPLTVPYNTMISFINVTRIDNDHIMLVNEKDVHYKHGDRVRVIDGKFAGVEGCVARVAGQQRVIVELYGICLIATAYIPTAFLKKIY